MTVLIAGCYGLNREDECEGYLRVVNPLPDTTMAVGDTLKLNINKLNVFEVSGDRDLGYTVQSIYGSDVVLFYGIKNPSDDNRVTLFILVAQKEGEALKDLVATSGCLENKDRFKVTVLKENQK